MNASSLEPLPLPSRPALTVPFSAAMFFWAGCALAYSTSDLRTQAECEQLALVALSLVLVASVFVTWKKSRLYALITAALMVGLSLGFAQAAELHANTAKLSDLKDEEVELTLLEDSQDKGFGESALAEVVLSNNMHVTVTARFGRGEPHLTGERFAACANFSAADYEKDSFAWQKSSCGTCKLSNPVQISAPVPLESLLQVRKCAIEGIGAQDASHALLQALVCGYRRNISNTELYSSFQTCGLAHLVAVSGAHLVIVTSLVASLLKRLRAPRKLTIAVLVGVMASYYIVAGMPVSALRALAMSALGLFAFFGQRRASSLNAVGIATFFILSSSPSACVSASFALSALSTIGIVLFAPLFQTWLDRSPLRVFPFISSALSLTFAATLLSQLYACSLFNQLSLIAPIANVITGPLFPIVCGAGLAAGIVCSALSALSGPAMFAACAPSSIMAYVVDALAKIPYAAIPFEIDSRAALALSATAALALWIAWPKPSWKKLAAFAAPVGLAVLILSFFAPANSDDAIIALDVGQGDAILIQSQNNRYLIDTGNQDSKLLKELARNQVIHLNGVIISHADDDHCGSLDALQRAVAVDRVIVVADMLESSGENARDLITQAQKSAPELVGVEVGDSFSIGAFRVEVIWPRSFKDGGGNADSLCLRLDYDGDNDGEVDFKALFTGDAESEVLASLLEGGAVGDIDVLKVAHHGSRNGMTLEQAQALSPSLALISCGAHNRYGHPTREILEVLSEVGARTLRTDEDGEIRCIFTPECISVNSG